jgi:hypothetical protein
MLLAQNVTSTAETAISRGVAPQTKQRPQWEIDKVLQRLLDADVRVAARSFSVPRSDSGAPSVLIDVRTLALPDSTQPGGLPVYFEGALRRFERHIGVVSVWLDCPSSAHAAQEGATSFRGRQAVILRGPAVVELAHPFRVERLPADPDNYWRDFRVPLVQFEFPFL